VVEIALGGAVDGVLDDVEALFPAQPLRHVAASVATIIRGSAVRACTPGF